jgi:hypothetical protein
MDDRSSLLGKRSQGVSPSRCKGRNNLSHLLRFSMPGTTGARRWRVYNETQGGVTRCPRTDPEVNEFTLGCVAITI